MDRRVSLSLSSPRVLPRVGPSNHWSLVMTTKARGHDRGEKYKGLPNR